MIKALVYIQIVFSVTMAISLQNDTCSQFEVIGPYLAWRDNEIIENKIIIADPTDDTEENDFALKISGENVTVRNVIIYHASNAMGIYGWKPHGLTIENVQVIAYGNEWGAQACPSRSPLSGYDCSNIKIYYAENLVMNNVHVENGSRGVSLVGCENAVLDGIVAKNVRGPFPAGQCVQIGYGHGSTLTRFTCINELDIAWPEDSISIYRSSDVLVSDGVIEGSNAPTGICLMFEGSDPDVHNGTIENVEARYCQGCFSGYPIDGLTERNLTCASPVCKSDEPMRGGKDYVNMWTAGDNIRDGVYASDINVTDSFYYDPCDSSEGRIYW